MGVAQLYQKQTAIMKFKTLHLSLIFCSFIFLASCGGDGEESTPTPETITVPAVRNVVIDDETDNGNSSDISIQFIKAFDETDIKEYWVVLVKASQSGSLALEQLLVLPAGNFQAVATTGSNQSFFLDAGLNDSDGAPITEGNEYVALVVSVSTDDENTISSISPISNEIELGVFSIKISYMGNMGVVISDGTKQVIIDGLHANVTGWYQASTSSLNALITGTAPWGNSDIAMTTHNHGDHFSPSTTNAFLSSNSDALYIAPPPARSGVSNTAAISQINPGFLESVIVEHNGIEVEVLSIRHFDQFGNDFSGVINYAYIVNIGGKKVMHVGDAFYENNNYSAFNLGAKNIDVLIIPTFGDLFSSSNRNVVTSFISPDNIIAAHLQTTTSLAGVSAIYPNAVIFTKSTDFRRY